MMRPSHLARAAAFLARAVVFALGDNLPSIVMPFDEMLRDNISYVD
jgi:hypothetical protein